MLLKRQLREILPLPHFQTYCKMIAKLSPEAVANWFISRAKEQGHLLTLPKLQRLTFFSDGWCLVFYDNPLVKEQPEAWSYGPVYPSLYEIGVFYGVEPIESPLSEPDTIPLLVPQDDPRIPLLQRIWDVYGKYSAAELSRIANEPDGPWDLTRRANPGRDKPGISNDTLKSYFHAQAQLCPHPCESSDISSNISSNIAP